MAPKAKRAKFASERLSEAASTGLQNEEDLIKIARSASSEKNTERAKNLLQQFASELKMSDPRTVTAGSSKMLVNLIYVHCKTGTEKPLSIDSVNGLIQGLRNVYSSHGHRGPWRADLETNHASGNPLEGNDDIKKLRASHKVHLSRIGLSKKRARPLSIALVCEHALRFWFGCGKPIDNRDVLLHSILLVGLNLGLRYDEVAKMKMQNVSVIPGITGTGSILLFIPESIKNSTKGREYQLRVWPGNTKLRNSLIADPFVAMLVWLKVRGNRPGSLFCHVNEKNMIDTSRDWSNHDFTEFFRNRLRLCGIGPGVTDLYHAHSLKRGAVQLYRSLGLRDENVMEIIQMTGANAYANYCAAYNECAPSSIPRFSNLEDFLAHAKALIKEQEHDS